MANTSMTIRTDKEVKQQASKIFSALGMDMTTAVNVFLRQAIRHNGIPFEIKADIPNAETIAAIKEAEEMIKNGTGRKFNSVEELFEELNS